MFVVDPKAPKPLVIQIVEGYRALIEAGKLRSGMKIPSIRQFAETNRVSMSTVVEAYDRLVAEGCLVARQNMGFFIREVGSERPSAKGEGERLPLGMETLWSVHKGWVTGNAAINPGSGWLPEDWFDDEALKKSLRAVAARPSAQLVGYGHPKGFPGLRWKIADWLREKEIYANPEQILMTSGAMHALSLLAKYLIGDGQTVFVEEPGFGTLNATLRLQGAKVVGVPMGPHGPDLESLEALAAEHKPRVFFINPRMQNPTGVSYDMPTSHRVLQLAERYDFLIVEDDIYAELDPFSSRCLAGMDQLNRVIYVNSFSKTIAPSLRVGYIAAHPDVIEDLTLHKIAAGLTSSELSERLAHEVLLDGRYRKHLRVLRERLADAQAQTCERLEAAGLELFHRPRAGMFVLARFPGLDDPGPLCNEANQRGILMAPVAAFCTAPDGSPWVRFNVAYCDSERLFEYLSMMSPQ
ncbi:MAG TPA: PLP-dependent aminotransferase family protein [Aromatoleum sp.]|uniref:aminotransferase-like domain-containing protein n=1 Tax=Aromatoleum sp. TaxID=2307007 RepID=UPI002B48B26C|nr:PLP-dependent aminotransferase family protein [Aromatoleum sp.]HJV24100.1 PLP-dependent aminotransferase family protein [Aromatoleum sp.]